jgi:MtaA/CmuA family methyltransferase
MNGYQRIRAALEGRWTDRRPVMLHNFMMAAREAGLRFQEFRSSPEKAAAAFIDAAERYDADGVLIDFDTATLAAACGAKTDQPVDGPARVVGPAFTDLAEAAGAEVPKLEEDPGVRAWLETCRIVKRHFGDEKYVRGNCDQAPFSLAALLRGAESWFTDLLTGRDAECDVLLGYCTRVCHKFMGLMAASGVDMLSNGDSLAGPELIGEDMYRRFALPYEQQVAQQAHRLGVPWVLHICGDTAPILAAMTESGADGLELDYKTSIREVHARLGCRMLFIGNIDPSGVLALGTPEHVMDETGRLLTIYRDSPRLVVNAGCALPPMTPAENIHALIRAVHRFDAGPVD